jgi:hypothetical protein
MFRHRHLVTRLTSRVSSFPLLCHEVLQTRLCLDLALMIVSTVWQAVADSAVVYPAASLRAHGVWAAARRHFHSDKLEHAG